MNKLFLLLALFPLSLQSQPSGFTKMLIPRFQYEHDFMATQFLQLSESTHLFFYLTSNNQIYQTKSTDGGNSWSVPKFIDHGRIDHPYDASNFSAYKAKTGRIFLAYRLDYTRYRYSDDEGETWQYKNDQYFRIGTTTRASHTLPSSGVLFQSSGSPLIYIFSYNLTRLSYTTSQNADTVWAPYVNIITSWPGKKIKEPGLVIQPSGKWICSFRAYDTIANNHSVYLLSSTDNGATWPNPSPVFTEEISFHRLINKPDGQLYLLYTKITDSIIAGSRILHNHDIYYRASTDDGATWSAETKITRYPYTDFNFCVSRFNDNINFVFASLRDSIYSASTLADGWKHYIYRPGVYRGILSVTPDTDYPPILIRERCVRADSVKSPFIFQAQVVGDSNYVVNATIIQSAGKTITLPLYDDGLHQDSLAGDGIYGNVAGGIIHPFGSASIQGGYKISVSRHSATALSGELSYLNFSGVTPVKSASFDINNLYVPLRHDVFTDGGWLYDSVSVIFNCGFYLSGMANGSLWANGLLSPALTNDYIPGPVRDYPGSGSLFILRSSDPPFSKSWQEWRLAVADGASFYDGDNDGVYSPFDKNTNGSWDSDEDRPDLIGDFTAWTVMNDGRLPRDRRFSNSYPLGIEVQQTLFGWSGTGTPLENSLFIRYRIINKSKNYERFDSVYFTIATDLDLGNYSNDLQGCDTLLNLGYAYDASPDTAYWAVGASSGAALVQGPAVFLPGITFTDVNGDGKYQHGTDIPLDSAFNHNGKYIGKNILPGAVNLAMTSFQPIFRAHPTHGDPYQIESVRYYQLGGMLIGGSLFDLCNSNFWIFNPPEACSSANRVFPLSGNPVDSTGWLSSIKIDVRDWVNSGPFTLFRNETVDIISAYSVGRHSSNTLASVDELKNNIRYLTGFYNDNFTQSGLPETNSSKRGVGFSLGDNYPNPFNPVTVIGFSIPIASDVSLKVFDILGREIADLVNEHKTSGYHKVQFNSSGLASGIYFYRIKAGEFTQIKKMVIVK